MLAGLGPPPIKLGEKIRELTGEAAKSKYLQLYNARGAEWAKRLERERERNTQNDDDWLK
jgi:hypothetical protein